jgi:hypothetical protein
VSLCMKRIGFISLRLLSRNGRSWSRSRPGQICRPNWPERIVAYTDRFLAAHPGRIVWHSPMETPPRSTESKSPPDTAIGN